MNENVPIRILVADDYLVVRKGPDGRMQLEETPIPEMPADLKQIIQDNK